MVSFHCWEGWPSSALPLVGGGAEEGLGRPGRCDGGALLAVTDRNQVEAAGAR